MHPAPPLYNLIKVIGNASDHTRCARWHKLNKGDVHMVNFTAADRVGTIGGYIGGIATLANAMGGCNGGLLGNLFGNNCGCHAVPVCSENTPVSRYENSLVQEIAKKDSENALLRAEVYSDQKLVAAYSDLQGQIKAVADEVRANKDAQNAVNMQQAVYNGTNTATISCIQGQVAQLLGLTKLVVPNTSVCPGWGNVTITPAASTPTTTPAA